MLRGGNSVHARLSLLSPDIVGAKMREIKFRAWDMRVKKMYFGGMDKFLENYPLMQYTGLKDKNGVEIYEGDIIKHNYRGWGVVEYDAPCFLVGEGKHDIQLSQCEPTEHLIVIGNIYETPELVK